jgi:amidase
MRSRAVTRTIGTLEWLGVLGWLAACDASSGTTNGDPANPPSAPANAAGAAAAGPPPPAEGDGTAQPASESATAGSMPDGILGPGVTVVPAPAMPGAAPAPAELELVEATLAELRAALAARLVTPAELTEMYLTRIGAFDADGPALNAYLELNADALADANALGDTCEDAATAPPLCGIPIVLKDNVDTQDLPTTAGSLALEGSLPERDAFITSRLRAAGAIILGKATLSEFANFLTTGMPSGYSSLGGFGFNPYDPRPAPGGDGRPVLTPGGSSSGSSIAVSANLAAAGIGTETSGSILSPASSNGIVGIKPTLGLVSRSGIIPISADQDTAGPLARSVADAAVLLGVLAGFDEDDSATSTCLEPGACEADYTRFLDAGALSGARFAVPPFPANRRVIMQSAIDLLQARGAVVDVISPLAAPAGACTAVPAGNGCSTVLLYGFKRDLDAYLAATPSAPVSSLAEIIAFNAATPGALVYDQQLAVAAQALDVAPGSPDTARYLRDRATALDVARATLDEVYDGPDGLAGTEDDVDALIFSENGGAGTPAVAGYPSITVPGGFLPPADGVANPFPSGVTFSGRAFSEPRLIAIAYAFEQATHFRQPPASAPALPTDTVKR